MIRTLFCTTALLIAVPAVAQQAAVPSSADPAAGQPQSATPAAPAQQPAPATPSDPAAAVASIVNTEFPAYDANGDGQLDQAEFSRWMVALKDQEMKATGKTLAPEQVSAWASGAFTTADADKSAAISKPELVSYLSGGAG